MTNDDKRNNNHSRRNKGISPVLGTIIFVLVAVAAIGTISFIFMAQDNYNTAVKKTTELVGNKGKEQITAVQLEEAKLQIANDGPATSRIIGLVSADDSSGNLHLEPLNLALPSAQKLDYTIPDGISGTVSGNGKIGLLTSLGNIFWVDSKPLQNTGNKFLNSVTYTVTGDTGTLTATLNNLQPGQSLSDTKTNPAGFSVTPGKTYPVSITATASDGSTAQYTSSVLASSG
ncbi:MAG: hypothetical protein HRF40_09620 [Nitrososphaera sp.]|jgi:flagellin-like protein